MSFYTVAIPHQMPAEVVDWPSKQDAIAHYQELWYSWDNYGTEYEKEPQGDEIFEWAGHDMNGFLAFESLGELEAWARAYASDSTPGGSGGHQSFRVLALVERMIEEVQP